MNSLRFYAAIYAWDAGGELYLYGNRNKDGTQTYRRRDLRNVTINRQVLIDEKLTIGYNHFERTGGYMFLHIGGDYIVSIRDVVAIVDMEKSTISQDTRNFLKISDEEGFIINVVENEMPKSFIITQEKHKSKIFLSPISTTTLLKRYELLEKKNIKRNEWEESKRI